MESRYTAINKGFSIQRDQPRLLGDRRTHIIQDESRFGVVLKRDHKLGHPHLFLDLVPSSLRTLIKDQTDSEVRAAVHRRSGGGSGAVGIAIQVNILRFRSWSGIFSSGAETCEAEEEQQ